jgi:hypothetical protein
MPRHLLHRLTIFAIAISVVDQFAQVHASCMPPCTPARRRMTILLDIPCVACVISYEPAFENAYC